MRLIKMLGLTAAVAMVVMAFAGATLASAATPNLCKANEATCAEGNTYPAETHVSGKLEAGKAAVLTGALQISCTVSEVLGTVSPGGTGKITSATWAVCEPNCTITSEGLPWSAFYTNEPDDLLIVNNPKVKIQCGIVTCTFTAEKVVLDVKGGAGGSEANDPLINAANEPLTSNCGNGTWNAPYTVSLIGGTSHAPGWITA